ncbi:MAG: hypothetical protein AB1589_28640 [Cyanobacteriota bacterium]
MPSLVTNQDGRPEMFVIGKDRAIWHKWTDSTGTWGSWNSMGGQWKQLAVAANQDGRLTVFAIGMDEAVWRCSQATPNGVFGGWSSLKGQWKQFAVAANQDGRLTVFAIGMDEAVWRCSQATPNGVFGGWSSLKGQWMQLSASRQPNGTLQVVALGFDGESYQISQTSPGGNWGSWQQVFIGIFPEELSGITAATVTNSLEFRLSPDSPVLSVISLANLSQSMVGSSVSSARKSTEELKKECVKEVAEAMLSFAGVYALNQARLAGAGPAGTGVAIAAGMVLTSVQINSAANKCAQAIQQTIDDSEDSDGSDGPGVSGLEEGRYWDYVESPSGGGIMIA